ncbi:MAG: carboxypeptidase-like regulatory domain-containing protein [Anaerolineales bacterium]|jgi:protocatechuate 3,4-dioxygenase beta subunit
MKAEKPKTEQELATQVSDLLDQLSSSRENALGDMLAIQTSTQALLQNEEQRLGKKLGPDHPRVQELHARRLAQLDIMRGLAVERQVASIRVPAIKENETLVQGRVVDEQGRGIPGVHVLLADDKGKTLVETQAVTDGSGYYALRLDPASLPPSRPAILTFANAHKQVLQRLDKPLSIQAGIQTIPAMQLDRLELAGLRQPAARPATKETEKATWEVSGTVTDQAGKPLTGLMVSAFDRDRKYDDKLGAALTDAKGHYRIQYHQQDFREGPEPGADLYLTVIDTQGRQLYSSRKHIRYNAGQREVFDIQIKVPPEQPK